MKKLLLLLSFVTILYSAKAQYVTIPDANFVAYLQANFPSCMVGNQMDTTCGGITGATTLNVANLSITDLTGVQYFDNLLYLHCENNLLTSLPNLPNMLKLLICSENSLISLPSLPNSLQTLACVANNLTSLPSLPPSLLTLNCNVNQISSLPTLPNTLQQLNCSFNPLGSIPALPNSLNDLWCYNDLLANLPSLPNSMLHLYCYHNQITNLPTLPTSILTLDCYANLLSGLPYLPNTLVSLICSSNNISCFPILPSSLVDPGAVFFNISNNPFTCLPNYVAAMDSLTLAYPICLTGDMINNPNNCSASTAVAINQLTMENEQWTISPNPTSGKFQISDFRYQIRSVEIRDFIGNVIQQQTTNNKQLTIDMSGFAKGIYFVRIESFDKLRMTPLVVNKKIIIQ